MPKIHYFQRYSSPENTVTNNTLQLIARIYSSSTTRASKLLSDITGEPIEIGIEVNQQERATDSIPDGLILQRSFKVLIESKVGSGVSEDQLVRHAKAFSNEAQKILLLLTIQKIDQDTEKHLAERIAKEHPGAVFKNVTYETVCDALKGLFQPYESEMTALIEDYVEYCNDTGLFDQSPHLMRIVPCGDSVDLNHKYGIYFHPSDRGYTKHSYIGIYARKQVQWIWHIDSVFDINWDGQHLTRKLIEGRNTSEYDEKIKAMIADAKVECGYDIQTGHRFFCGKGAKETKYQKVSFGGIQGARLVNIRDIVGQFADEEDLANKLSKKTWE